MSDLLIVGMSLEDKYLRKHIECFRKDIRDVYWFVKPAADEQSWAKEHKIEMIEISDWNQFWTAVECLPSPDKIKELEAWKRTVQKALWAVEGGERWHYHHWNRAHAITPPDLSKTQTVYASERGQDVNEPAVVELTTEEIKFIFSYIDRKIQEIETQDRSWSKQ